MSDIDDGLLSPTTRSLSSLDGWFESNFIELPQGFRWLNGVFSSVRYGTYTQTYRRWHQVCSFLSRLTLNVKSLEDEALSSWVSTQESVSSRVDERVTHVIRTLFADIPPDVKCGSHGNGASYIHQGDGLTTRDPRVKYSSAVFSRMLTYVDRKYGDGQVLHPFGRESATVPPSCLHLVPKSYRKLRSIAIEPPGSMWAQQAVFRAFDRAFLTVPALRRRIRLHDSSRNCRLARLGSIDGRLSTIDLSHASDDVSWMLVKEAFRDTPWLPWIWACRTREVKLPDGSLYPLRSHASMGSALCFPVECVIFMAATEVAIAGLGDDPRRSKYSIYGDDIVVETRYAAAVEDQLKSMGFTINRAKSYSDLSIHPYRESCGGEYMSGVDVTPLRISRRFTAPRYGAVTPAQYESLVELANGAFASFPTLRRYALSWLLSLPSEYQPLFVYPDEDGGVWSWSPTNFHLRRDQRWSVRFQRPIYRSGVVSTCHRDRPAFDSEIDLFDWLRQAELGRQEITPGVELPVGSTVNPPLGLCVRCKPRT